MFRFKKVTPVILLGLSLTVAKTSTAEETNTVELRSAQQGQSTETARQKLMNYMSKINQFTAKFNQQVYSDDGNALHKSSGVISVSKPNLVNWHTILPEETQIISDGETLWFFDPFIEQVTAYSLDSSIQNTPILLLSSNDEQLWQQFDIVQNDLNTFEIIALDQNSQVKSLSLVLSVSGNEKETKIEKFVIVDASGQRSEIKLSHFEQSNNISKDTYKFELPDGVYLDDQR